MRADMADRERAERMPVLPRKSGPTQAILCVEFAYECIIHCMTLLLAPLLEVALRWQPFVGLCIGLFSGIWEYEKIQTYMQSYSHEIDKHNIPEGS